MAPLIFDVVSYRNQLEACKKTFGIVPHPAFERLEAPSGQPMSTPWIVCAVGRPAQQAEPANNFSLTSPTEPTVTHRAAPFPSFDFEPPLPAIPDARTTWRDLDFAKDDAEEIRRYEEKARLRTMPRVEIKNVWTDYDVARDGMAGMLIHTQFASANLQNEGLQVIASFYYEKTQKPVESAAHEFSTTNATLCVSNNFTPPYRHALYEDFQLFLPVNAFGVHTSGVWKLTFEVVIRQTEPNWTVLARSPWQYCDFTL